MSISVILTLRNQEVEISECEIGAAEPDVGIMLPYLECYSLKDLDGQPLDWDLSEEEESQIAQAVLEAHFDSSSEEY